MAENFKSIKNLDKKVLAELKSDAVKQNISIEELLKKLLIEHKKICNVS